MYQNKPISKIGLGCVTFGREIDRSDSFLMMDYALKSAITFFDTASAYQNGISEQIVGSWLASRRPNSDQVMVATKISPPYTSERVVKLVHKSLKHLKVDTIDLLYLHSWDESVKTGNILLILDEMVKQGKIRVLGASNFTGAQLGEAISLQKSFGGDHFKFAQNNHNLAASDLTQDFKEVCIQNRVEIVTYSPLGAGFLTGKYDYGIAPGTRFEIIPGHQDIYFNEQAFKRLERLKKIAHSTGYSVVHLALAWALHQPGIKSVLIGGRKPAHLKQALIASNFYDQEIFADLEDDN